MSLKTWKAEFYPIPARLVKKADALAHSLRKWEGLRQENMERHGLVQTYGGIHETPNATRWLDIDDSTCALCVRYECDGCPLFRALEDRCYGVIDAPYNQWLRTGDPEPMIAALKKAMEEPR